MMMKKMRWGWLEEGDWNWLHLCAARQTRFCTESGATCFLWGISFVHSIPFPPPLWYPPSSSSSYSFNHSIPSFLTNSNTLKSQSVNHIQSRLCRFYVQSAVAGRKKRRRRGDKRKQNLSAVQCSTHHHPSSSFAPFLPTTDSVLPNKFHGKPPSAPRFVCPFTDFIRQRKTQKTLKRVEYQLGQRQ